MWRRMGKLLLLILICIRSMELNHAKPQVPCYFIFGDSLSDAGNNNNLKTKSKANYPPYGVDFPTHHPTGRFTNGKTAVDIISEHLGFEEYIPPFSTTNGQQIVKGVNYASGSCGICSETGQHLGNRISLGQQLKNHKTIISKLGSLVKGSVRDHLHSCLYTVNIGSNDYLNNYFMPKHYNTSDRYNTTQFASTLVEQLSRQTKTLYKNGARKVALFGLGPIGCTVIAVTLHQPNMFCVDSINDAAEEFNKRLKSLVDEHNSKLPGAHFTFINNQAIKLVSDRQGFAVQNETCCKIRNDFQCMEAKAACKHRNIHIFWDGIHPTEAVNQITGGRAYKADTFLDAHPFDISQLVEL